MNYFMYSTILSVFTIFLASRSDGLMRFLGPYKLIKTKDCPQNLDIYRPNANGQFPAKVMTPKFHITFNERIKLDITWTANIKNVKGFKIVLKPSGMPDICRILDYSDVITDSSSGVYSFGFSFKPIFADKTWRAKLYPLPSLDNSSDLIEFDTILKPGTYDEQKTFKVADNNQTKLSIERDCSSFAPPFDYQYDGKNLMITLTKGPALCNYKEYKILILYQNNTTLVEKIIPTRANVDKVRAYFKLNICEGYYKILVSVFDRYFSDSSKCVCKHENNCKRCVNSIIEKLYMVPAKSCMPKTTSARSEEPKQDKLIFFLGVFIGLLFLTALVLYFIHWKLSVYLTMKKRGIVLLLDDHEPHTSAVTKVVDYLNECHLNVHLASAFLRDHDIPDQMVVIAEVLKSDFVLLILSSALQKRMEAWDKQQDYVEFFKERNSNILTKPFLEVLLGSSNLYACKFDHVTEFGSWPKPCYSLPSDLTRMVAELNGQSFSQRSILCNCLKSNALRDKLQIAIEKTIMYEKSHANWFLKKYLCPSNVAVSHFIVDETSIDQSEHTNAPKLKEIFTGYKNTFISLPEDTTIAPSIYSERLEEINKRNL